MTAFGGSGIATSTSTTSRPSRCRQAAAATVRPTSRTSSWPPASPTSRRRRRCSKRDSAGRRRKRGRTRRRSARRRHSTPTASPVCRRIPAFGRPSQPAHRRPVSDLGRQATNPQWQYPTVYNPKVNYTWMVGRHSLKSGYEFQHIQTEVQDVNPLYGRDHLRRSAHAPRGRWYQQRSTTCPTSCSACAASTRSATSWSPISDRTCTSSICRTTSASTSSLTLNLGRALRVRDAMGREGQHPARTSTRRPGRWSWPVTDRSRIAHLVKPDRNNFGPRLGLAYTLQQSHRTRVAATASATSTSIAPVAPTCCPSTARRSSTPSSCRATRSIRRFAEPNRGTTWASPIRRGSTRSRRTSPTCRETTTRARSRAGSRRCSASSGRG